MIKKYPHENTTEDNKRFSRIVTKDWMNAKVGKWETNEEKKRWTFTNDKRNEKTGKVGATVRRKERRK